VHVIFATREHVVGRKCCSVFGRRLA